MAEIDPQLQAVISDTAQRAARHAVRETFLTLGFDVSDPLEVQKDIAAIREIRQTFNDDEMQADLVHLRSWRKTMEAVRSKGFMTAVGLLITAAMTAMWLGVKGQFGN